MPFYVRDYRFLRQIRKFMSTDLRVSLSVWGRLMKTNLVHYLSTVYFVSQILHVSGIFVSHNQEVYCIYVTRTKCCTRWGADKSLARPTFRCRRTESIVSLERGVCSCADLQVFSCYRGWKKQVRRRARFQNIETRVLIKFFFSCTAMRRTKFTPFWQKH